MACGALWQLLSILGIALLYRVNGQNPQKRFEYKHSFKGPYLAQKDNQVPFWTYSGNAIASSESLRITPSLRSQKGQAWSKRATTFEWWEVELVFRITGRGRVGADGLAFWFTTSPGVEGPVFGSSDQWNGLGLFFDSFDNDNKRNNPYIMAMANDGTKVYDHENDGMSQMLGGCLRDFRNKPNPIKAKIEYFKNTLTVKVQKEKYDTSKRLTGEEKHASIYHIFHTGESSMTESNDSHTMEDSHHDEPASSIVDPWFGDDGEVHIEETDASYTDTIENTDSQWFAWKSDDNPTVSVDVLPQGPDSNASDQPDDTVMKERAAKERRKAKRRQLKERRRKGRQQRRMKSKVMVHNGLTKNEKDFEICMRVENVVLPSSGYFGLSAATGGLADDHDVLKLLVSSIRTEEMQQNTNNEQEQQFQKEFIEYQEKTKKARDEYVAAHPDAVPKHGYDDDDDFEGSELRELRQIFEGQTQIYEVIRQLNAKMDEIVGRQERTLSLVGAVHSSVQLGGAPAQVGGAPVGGAPIPPVAGGSPISRFEVDNIINTQRDISNMAREVKTVVLDINQKSNTIVNKVNAPVGSAQPIGNAYDMHATIKEVNEGLNIIKHSLGANQQRQGPGGPTVIPACPSCLSTWMFVGVAVGQLVIILGYMLLRDNKEAQAKKFY